MENKGHNNGSGFVVSAICAAVLMAAVCYAVFFASRGVYNMSLGFNLARGVAAVVVFILVVAFAPLPTDVPWYSRLRGSIAVLVGGCVLGLLLWPLVSPATDGDSVLFYTGSISLIDAIICLPVCFSLGYVSLILMGKSSFNAAICTVPAGMAVWSVRSASLSDTLAVVSAKSGFADLYGALSWEGFYWMILCAAGFAGAVVAARLFSGRRLLGEYKFQVTQMLMSLVISVIIAWIAIGIFCQTIAYGGKFVQPGPWQAAFGVTISFAFAAFAVKKLLKCSYVCPAISSSVVLFIAAQAAQNKMDQNVPVAYFNSLVASILPIQMVSFGVLGSISGYWFAVLFEKWQKDNA